MNAVSRIGLPCSENLSVPMRSMLRILPVEVGTWMRVRSADRLEARRHGIVLVDRVVDERQQRRFLVGGNRRRGIVLEALVLGGADGFDLGGVVFLFRPQRARRGRNCEDDQERLTKHIFTITCQIGFLEFLEFLEFL